ncbi:MAG TPA: hypothetical protein VHV83_10715 [Armatimonadota bacterium]|nr:hypothetical protein [Armatimonadota bacterium]
MHVFNKYLSIALAVICLFVLAASIDDVIGHIRQHRDWAQQQPRFVAVAHARLYDPVLATYLRAYTNCGRLFPSFRQFQASAYYPYREDYTLGRHRPNHHPPTRRRCRQNAGG